MITCDPGSSTHLRPLAINRLRSCKDTGLVENCRAWSSGIIECHMGGSGLGWLVLNRPVVGCCCMFSCIEKVYRKSSTQNSVITCSRPARCAKAKRDVLANVNAAPSKWEKNHLCSHRFKYGTYGNTPVWMCRSLIKHKLQEAVVYNEFRMTEGQS